MLLLMLVPLLGLGIHMRTPVWALALTVAISAVSLWRLEWALVALGLSYSFALPVIRTPLGWSAFVRADDIALLGLTLNWMLIHRGRLRDLIAASPLTRPLLAWCGLVLLSTFASAIVFRDRASTATSGLALIRTYEFVLVYFLVITSVQDPRQYEAMKRAVLIGAAGVALFAIGLYLLGACIPLLGWARAVAPNTSLLDENYRHHGAFMLLAIFLAQGALLSEPRTARRIILAAAICLFVVSLVMSTSRSAYVGFLVASIVAGLGWRGLTRPRLGYALAGLPALLLPILVLSLPYRDTEDIRLRWAEIRKAPPPVIAATETPPGLSEAEFKLSIDREETRVEPLQRIQRTGDERSSEVDFERRFDTWRLVLTQAVRKPWRLVTGVGFARFRYSNLGEWMRTAHNNFLHVFAELGLPGLFIFLWGGWVTVAFLRKQALADARQAFLAAAVLFGLVGLAVTAIVQETFYATTASSSSPGLFLYVIGLTVAAAKMGTSAGHGGDDTDWQPDHTSQPIA